MKLLAVSHIAWPGEDEAEGIARARAAGFDAIELAPAKAFGPWAEIELGAVRQRVARFAAEGLPVVAMQGLTFGAAGKLFGTAEERAALAAHLGLVARIAGACGGVPCVFGAPGARDPGTLSPEVAWTMAAEELAGIAPRFAGEGACLALEAVPAAHGGKFVTDTAEAARLVREVGSPGLSLQLDTATMLANGETFDPAWVALAAHCHASVPHLAPVGPGHPGLVALIGAARAAGYGNWVSVEMRAAADWRAALDRAALLRAEIA